MNIIFIVVDTLRASRLGAYGYPKPTSPNIDRLLNAGARFSRCFAAGVPTTPAHTTMFTGMHPIAHNIVTHGGSVDLDRKVPVLAEMLQNAGYTTAAVDNLYDIKPWLARGYEYYINPSFRHKLRLLMSCEEVNARAIPWLREHAKEKFFLFLHYWEPHTPYLPPDRYRMFYPSDRDPFSESHTSFEGIKKQPFWGMFGDIWFSRLGPVTDAEYIASLYDAEIRHVDEGIGALMAALDELKLSEDTLIVFTGDHGESMYQHDIFFDHHGLYEDIIHVPFGLTLPDRLPAGTVVPAMIQHTDIAPTILEAAGVPVPGGLDGVSAWPLATRQTDEGGRDEIVCCECTWQAKWALRTGSRKLILSRRPDRHNMPMRELYDLDADPGEECNLAEVNTEEADALELRLENWIASELARHSRTEDPLIVQDITLGKRWDSWTPATDSAR